MTYSTGRANISGLKRGNNALELFGKNGGFYVKRGNKSAFSTFKHWLVSGSGKFEWTGVVESDISKLRRFTMVEYLEKVDSFPLRFFISVEMLSYLVGTQLWFGIFL